MVNSRQKGSKAELKAAAMLKTYTGIDFTGTPGSGSGKIKGDLYVLDKHNIFMIEAKQKELVVTILVILILIIF